MVGDEDEGVRKKKKMMGSGCEFLKLNVDHVFWVSWLFSGFVYEFFFL